MSRTVLSYPLLLAPSPRLKLSSWWRRQTRRQHRPRRRWKLSAIALRCWRWRCGVSLRPTATPLSSTCGARWRTRWRSTRCTTTRPCSAETELACSCCVGQAPRRPPPPCPPPQAPVPQHHRQWRVLELAPGLGLVYERQLQHHPATSQTMSLAPQHQASSRPRQRHSQVSVLVSSSSALRVCRLINGVVLATPP